MATKKKKKANNGPALSPERLIKERMRGLEIGRCYRTENMEKFGRGIVLVSRRHTGGRVSYCCYMLDSFCRGVTDAAWYLREEEEAIDEIIDMQQGVADMVPCDYATAHNWIYGAVAWAEDAGIKPCKQWSLAQYFLDEDTDDVPLMELPFGREGKHFLIAYSRAELSHYLPTLKKNLGEDFDYELLEEDNEDYYDFDDEPDEDYFYEHPAFPTELHLRHPEARDLLMGSEDHWWLTAEASQYLLALPHDELRTDLKALLAYTLGRLYDGKCRENELSIIENAATLLGEVGEGAEDLDLVLEIFRLPHELYFEATSDFMEYSLIPALYKLGYCQFDTLLAYMLQPGLGDLGKGCISQAVSEIALQNPERYAEVIGWYHQVLQSAIREADDEEVDYNTLGLIVADLIDIHAAELMPDIELAYDMDIVDRTVCGSIEDVKSELISHSNTREPLEMDLYRRISQLRKIEERDR